MSFFLSNSIAFFHNQINNAHKNELHNHHPLPRIQATIPNQETETQRRSFLTSFLATSVALSLHATPSALAENWGARSFLRERYFEPGLSPEDSVARIRQTAEGLHSIRDMLDTMSWVYVLHYIRLKQAYLQQDMKTAMTMVPESRRNSYVETANELVDHMTEGKDKACQLLMWWNHVSKIDDDAMSHIVDAYTSIVDMFYP